MDSSLLILKLCTNSSNPKLTKAIVLPTSTPYKEFPMLNATKVRTPSIVPSAKILLHKPSAKIPFLLSRGFLFIISLSGTSNPNAIAGNESVTRFTHNN